MRILYVILLSITLLLSAPGIVGVAQAPEAATADDGGSQHALGLVPSPPGDYPRLGLKSQETSLPSRVDLSAGLPPVGSQGRQASCVGWAIAYYRSYQEGVENGRVPREPSEIFSPAYVYNQRRTSDCGRDVGMSYVDGLRIAVEHGMATMATMPYDPTDSCSLPSEEAIAEAALYRSDAYLNLFAGQGTANLDLLRQHLATGDPFLLAAPIYSEFYRVTASNPVIDVAAEGSRFYGGHGILIVGYDDTTERFKFVNSWGQYWGDGGFAYLTYDFVSEQAWEAWVLVDSDTTPPKLSAEAYELGGAQSGVAQSEIDSPVFAWQKSRDATAVYNIYWGNDPEGSADLATPDSVFAAGQVTAPSTHYLRVSASDQAGNSTDWRTLFEFRYERIEEESPLVPLQPVMSRADIIAGTLTSHREPIR